MLTVGSDFFTARPVGHRPELPRCQVDTDVSQHLIHTGAKLCAQRAQALAPVVRDTRGTRGTLPSYPTEKKERAPAHHEVLERHAVLYAVECTWSAVHCVPLVCVEACYDTRPCGEWKRADHRQLSHPLREAHYIRRGLHGQQSVSADDRMHLASATTRSHSSLRQKALPLHACTTVFFVRNSK